MRFSARKMTTIRVALMSSDIKDMAAQVDTGLNLSGPRCQQVVDMFSAPEQEVDLSVMPDKGVEEPTCSKVLDSDWAVHEARDYPFFCTVVKF